MGKRKRQGGACIEETRDKGLGHPPPPSGSGFWEFARQREQIEGTVYNEQ